MGFLRYAAMKSWLRIRLEAMCMRGIEVLQTLVTWASKQGLVGDTWWVGGITEEFS